MGLHIVPELVAVVCDHGDSLLLKRNDPVIEAKQLLQRERHVADKRTKQGWVRTSRELTKAAKTWVL